MDRYRFWLRERLADYQEWIDGRDRLRFELVLIACLVVGLTAIICSAYLTSLHGFEVGQSAPRTVVAGKTVTALDAQATENLKARVARLVESVYTPDPQALAKAADDLETFFEEAGRLRLELPAGAGLDEALTELEAAAPDTTSAETLEYLLTTGPGIYDQVQRQALGVLETMYAGRIAEGTLPGARSTLRSITDALAVSAATATAVYEVAAGFLRPNQLVDEEQTMARKNAAMDEVAPVLLTIRRGELVVEEGMVVSAENAVALQALGLTETRAGWKIWLGIFLVVLLEAAAFSLLLYRFNRPKGFSNNMLLALVTLTIGATAVARGLVIPPLSAYLIPVAALGMVVAIVLNARSALLLVVLTSVNVGLLTDLDMRFSALAVIVGVLSLYFVSRVAQRAALLGAGLLTMILTAFTVFSIELFTEAAVGEALRASLWGLANGLLVGVLTVLLLLILDTIFNLTTPLRLLELENLAQPLLKKLLQVAPGTYIHSMNMGYLAEAAAEAIGADTLLARVGAYYHDIGKTVRPEYFVENQSYDDNRHDRLKPSLSRLAITAHVRDGEHLAKLYGVPAPVVDIIKQHHGTSVLEYFYHKAQETSRDLVEEESFRYEEQKPRSKEAAIVMLADQVEAAVKAIENPTRRKIQGVLQEKFMQSIQDGQLDESPLTQADLHKIRDAFDTTLRGLVGHRIRYPEHNGQHDRRSSRRPGSSEGGPAVSPGATASTEGSASSDAQAGTGQPSDPSGGGR